LRISLRIYWWLGAMSRGERARDKCLCRGVER
jgi:hypothetical protein